MEKITKNAYAKLKENVALIIENSKRKALQAINQEFVQRNWLIGKYIVEYEQKGDKRAKYGLEIINRLSEDLTLKYGKGFSKRNLRNFRKFYEYFPKGHPVGAKLTWTNIRLIINIENKDERDFYMVESENCNWSKRELERQIRSHLYERLKVSKDKEKILELSKQGQIIEKASDIIKDPIYLDFLDLKENSSYNESNLENSIISKIQEFILELGKGFSFVARQYRITIEGTNYYPDLVFYNRYLKCFIIIELKTQEFKPEFIGQLQFYVNYFDKYEKLNEENSTVGIIICENKQESIVKLSLPKKDSQLFAVQYKKYLPTIEEIKNSIKK